MSLSATEIERYSRQLVMPQWSGAAQKRLRVVIVGAGALGAPVGAYLAGAGVGALEILDSDQVELSNLPRQHLFAQDDVGAAKAEVAARRLTAGNPEVTVDGRRVRVEGGNAAELLAGASLVVDCSDSFATRYAVNEACCSQGVALVEAGVLGLDGLVLSIRPGESACYRCAFPVEPPPGSVSSCREAGVLGPFAGVVGSVQALEALKLLTGVGEPLLDRILQIHGGDMTQTMVSVHRRSGCPSCASVAASTHAMA